MEKKIRDLEAASAYTTIPVNTLRYYRKMGIGPVSFRLGRRVMYRDSDLDAYLEAQYQAGRTDNASAMGQIDDFLDGQPDR